jgi:PEP-CTERM motif-containing protein
MFYRKVTNRTWVWMLLVPLLLSPLSASTVHWDSTDWEANTSVFSIIDFNSETPGIYSNSTGLVTGSPSVQFLGISSPAPANQLWVVDPATYPTHDFGSGPVLKGPMYDGTANRSLQINLPADITSFAIELMALGPAATEFALVLSTGDQWDTIAVGASPQTKFVGATTDIPISSIQILMTDGVAWESFPVFDNFRYGAAGSAEAAVAGDETPEAATLLLVGSGLLFVWMRRRRTLAPVT